MEPKIVIQTRRHIEVNKQFKQQDSLLTYLINGNQHIRSLYNIIMAFVTVYVITTIGDYVANPQRFQQDYSLFRWNIRYFYLHFLFPWTFMNLLLLGLLYPLVMFRQWLQFKNLAAAKKKHDVNEDDLHFDCCLTKTQSVMITAAYIAISGCGIIAFCSWYIFRHRAEMSPAISFALTMEMTRLTMKAHSYFVEKGRPYALDRHEAKKMYKSLLKENRATTWSNFSKFLYYLFAPTLIYRDLYPRNISINWSRVFGLSVQMIFAVAILFVALNRFLVDTFSNIGLEPFDVSLAFRSIGQGFLFATITCFLVHFAFLHVWHSITAEVLRFAERSFYGPWWESTSLGEYYRKWNLLVQEWLYTYIYVPTYNQTTNRALASFITVFISGIAHEYIIAMTLHFFFPLLFVIFVLMGHLMYIATRNLQRSNISNTLFMMCNIAGWGFITSAYSAEWYSRNNCPIPENAPLVDHLYPRLLNCMRLK